MNLWDKVIGAFSPKSAYERMMWREAMRSYDAGSHDRLNAGWTSFNATSEQTDKYQRDILRARGRDLERNSDITESIINPFERNVIGTGIMAQAKILKEDGKEDDALNEQIEELWKEWCLAKNCDITGQQCFNEFQAMAVRRLKVDGGIFFIKVYTDEGLLPFKLQVKEVDELDTSYSLISSINGNRIVDGIELNAYNKPIAYYFRKYTPDGFYTGETERMDAQRVIFLWRKKRPSQIREVSELANTLPRVKEVNEFVEAVSVKERILACLSVFITKQTPNLPSVRGTTDKKSGYQVRTISPGMIQELSPGDKIETVNPSGQASNAREFIMSQQRMAGAGQGLSYEVTSRDMSQVNYSSVRQGYLEDQRTYQMLQKFIIDHFCYEVYTEFIISAVLKKELVIEDFWQNKRKYLRHEWITPGWSWIDPLKEASANISSMNAGFNTLKDICGAQGKDWKEVLAQRKKEQEYAKELGVLLSATDPIEEGDDTNAEKT